MVKLLCSKCNSNDIAYFDTDTPEEMFKCEGCQHEFPFKDAEWEAE